MYSLTVKEKGNKCEIAIVTEIIPLLLEAYLL